MAFSLAALLGVLVACGPGAPKSGTIVERWYEERREWDTTYYTTQCIAYNKDGGCTSSISIPHQLHHVDDEDFVVTLEDCHYKDDGSGEKSCRRGRREISKQDWERLKEGDFYGAEGNSN